MMLVSLFFEFFKIGLFAVGGGLATLPFLYEIADKSSWLTTGDISNMVAISESTPGPMGVNMATYVGFLQSGPIGGIIATLGLITPSVIVIILVARVLNKFKNSKMVENVFYGLRAASCALIAVAGVGVAKLAFFGESFDSINYKSIILAVLIFFAMKKIKLHPVAFIAISAVIGIIFKF